MSKQVPQWMIDEINESTKEYAGYRSMVYSVIKCDYGLTGCTERYNYTEIENDIKVQHEKGKCFCEAAEYIAIKHYENGGKFQERSDGKPNNKKVNIARH